MILNLKEKKLFNTIFWSCLFISLAIQPLSAQFTITEDFRGGGSPDIIIGDDAYLTSGIDDPVGAGWLRLTKAIGNQKGYAYVNKSFPSTLGVLIDFEYTMWRDVADNTYDGADGFSIFLFDAAYGPGNFALGAYGGSLGYANSTATTPESPGLTGGYLGIGFDAYGNFVNASEGKNGGSTSESPNSIALRGPTTSTDPADTNTNKYLEGITLFPDGSTEDALSIQGNAEENVIDYNQVSSTRPSLTAFYRRVQIEIIPTGTGLFEIVVRWAKVQGGAFTEVMSYTTNDAPPSLLKLGFAASTGGGFNNHEIRNILVSTPGNLRVYKLANKDILRSVPGTGSESENEVTFMLEVTNDTDSSLQNINVTDQFSDGDGNPLPDGMFKITDITADANFLSGSVNLPNPTPSSPITNGSFSGSVGLPANASGIIKVTGYLDGQIPYGNLLHNAVEVSNNEITDQDLENNRSTISVPVLAEKVDMVIDKTVDDFCINTTGGNTFTIHVSNMGTLEANYTNTGKIKVIETIPAGATMSASSNMDWDVSNSGNTYTFTKTGVGTLTSGMSLPPFTYTITNNESFTSTSEVQFINDDSNTILEPVENRGNNIKDVFITGQPDMPLTASETIYYCQGEVATALVAEPDPGNTLLWYLNVGGAPSDSAPVPFTDTPGSTVYYVTQTNGNCESELREIEVVVLENPTPGSIAGGGEVCINSVPNLLTNNTVGTGFGELSYRWEYSRDNGATWEEVSGENEANFQPSAIQTDTLFRRITIATNSDDHSCESVASNEVSITVRNCMLITNPMLPSKAKQ